MSESPEAINLDKMSLEEVPTDQLLTMQKTLEKLVASIEDISKKGSIQVKLSTTALKERVEALRGVPSALREHNEHTRAQSRNAENLEALASSCIETECEQVCSEIQALEEVGELLVKQRGLTSQALQLLTKCSQGIRDRTQIAREYARRVNDKMRERMKASYDREKGVESCPAPPKVGDRVYMRIPSEKQSSSHPKLANPWEGPYRVIEASENSALITLINQDKEPVRVPFDLLRKLPQGISDEPLLTRKSRGKRGRPKKNKTQEVPCNKISLFRTLLASDDRLNLRFRCSCGLFGQMAHVAIPGLKHPLARAKTVNDMFELANIASISEQECWSDERKERELRRKHSQYLSPYGLAVAMDAHRRRCPLYAKRVEEARGMKYDHPAIYPWPCEYPIGDILAEAIMMLDQIEMPLLNHHMDRRTFIALPTSFARLDSEVAYEDNVILYIYRDFGTLASKLLTAREVMKAVVIVWPDNLPESRQMRQLLISIERHLQDGGTLAFLPSPYEDRNAEEWRRVGEVCREFVRFLTDPSRNFLAVTRDHYSGVLDHAPYTHPACCLGVNPRRSGAPFIGPQILTFLEKVRITVNDLIRLPKFEPATP
ncbi:unnamed protein product [Cylicocyclus nassatus]|uniref:Integrase-type domain-containing protein n=1 Tax=Cylicocyclus nassatus TaxID=53992 RepID=A0AA36HBY3_CYLNA|nr:unnamed protein product [Cylicocyclus nassatus]